LTEEQKTRHRAQAKAWARANPDRVKANKARWAKENPERIRAQARKTARKRAGHANPSEETRSGPCEVCSRACDPLHLDHDHASGKTRGWLCGPCNRAIGLLRDDPALVRALAYYLERNQ
jgi:hypothetical protein